MKKGTITNKDKRNKIIYLSLIILLTIITFSNSLFNGLISYDDPGYITENALIRGLSFENIRLIFSSFVMGNYHPFVVLGDAIVYHFFNLNPTPYHAFSLLFHLLNVVIVFYLAYELFSPQSAVHSPQTSSLRIQSSALVACLFAIQPMHCETVCWASDLKDLLFTLFYLISLIFYIKYIKSTVHSPQSTESTEKSKFYVISLLLFACSCFSKSAAVTFPLIMLATDYLLNRKLSKSTMIEKVPFFILSLGFGIINIFSQASAKAYSDLGHFNILDRIWFPVYNLAFYIISSVIPFKLSVNHPYPDKINNFLPLEYYIFPLIVLVLIGLIVIFRGRNKSTVHSSQSTRYLIFGLLFFIINLALVLQIIPVGWSLVSERYTYLAYFGLFFIIGYYYQGFKEFKGIKRSHINILIIIVLLTFSYMSYERNKVWANNLSLYDDVISKYPNAFFAYGNRGLAKDDLGDKQGALDDYNKALELNPHNSEAYNNRGLVKDHMGDYRGAADDYTKALEINPKYDEAYVGRGNAKNAMGNYEGAIEDYNKALEINIKSAKAYYNRGVVKATLGKMQEAIVDFNTSIEINPQYAEAFNNRGNAKGSLGDMHGAINDFTKSIEINPQNAQAFDNRGKAEFALGDKNGACSDWNKAGELGMKESYEMVRKYCN